MAGRIIYFLPAFVDWLLLKRRFFLQT